MQELYDLLGFISDTGQTIIDFFESTPDIFTQFMAWLNLWYIKISLYFKIMSIKLAYETAKLLLEDIGFYTVVESAWDALPSELRYYGTIFGFPKAFSIIANCFTTSIVMRLGSS